MKLSVFNKTKSIDKLFSKPCYLALSFLLINILVCEAVYAEYGLALGYGLNANTYAWRLSLQVDSSLCLDNKIWPATGYWEGSANYISSKFNSRENLKGVSLAYVVHFEKTDLYCRKNVPYVEFGFGGALFDNKNFNQRHLGSTGLFEIKMGAGIRLGQYKEYDLSYKFIHYSNAFLRQPNDGINLNFFVFSYLF